MINKDYMFVLALGAIGLLALFGVNKNITSTQPLTHLNQDQFMVDRMSESLAVSLKKNGELKNSILGATAKINKTIGENTRPSLKNYIEEIKLLLGTHQNDISQEDIAGARKKAEIVVKAIRTSSLDETEKQIYVVEISKIISSLDRMADISIIKKSIAEKKALNGVSLKDDRIQSLEMAVKDFERKAAQNRWFFGLTSLLSFLIIGFYLIFRRADTKDIKAVTNVSSPEIKHISSEYVQEAFASLFTGTPYTLWIDKVVEAESNPLIVELNDVIFSYVKKIVPNQAPNTIVLYSAFVSEGSLNVMVMLEDVSIQSHGLHYKVLQDYIQSLNGEIQFDQRVQTKIHFLIPT